MKKITDPTFVYRNSASTDIRKTFARVRKEQREAKAAEVAALAKVQPIRKAAK